MCSRKTSGNVVHPAESLGVDRRTLFRKMKDFNLEKD